MSIRALIVDPTTPTSGGALSLYLIPTQILSLLGTLTMVYLLVTPPVATGLFISCAFKYAS